MQQLFKLLLALVIVFVLGFAVSSFLEENYSRFAIEDEIELEDDATDM